MDGVQSQHLARMRHLRESFVAANERLVTRLRGASDEAAARHVTGAWSAAQIGWHVATVSTRFAAMIAGDIPGPQPLAESFRGAALGRDRGGDSRSAEGALGRAPAARRQAQRCGLGARGIGDEDGACLRRADVRTRRPHGRDQRRGRHHHRVSACRVGDGPHRAP